MKINNKVNHNTVYSDCVYPNWTDKNQFTIVGILDKEFVEEELERLFEANQIANKYAIQMPNDIIWYKHDFKVYALILVNK